MLSKTSRVVSTPSKPFAVMLTSPFAVSDKSTVVPMPLGNVTTLGVPSVRVVLFAGAVGVGVVGVGVGVVAVGVGVAVGRGVEVGGSPGSDVDGTCVSTTAVLCCVTTTNVA